MAGLAKTDRFWETGMNKGAGRDAWASPFYSKVKSTRTTFSYKNAGANVSTKTKSYHLLNIEVQGVSVGELDNLIGAQDLYEMQD